MKIAYAFVVVLLMTTHLYDRLTVDYSNIGTKEEALEILNKYRIQSGMTPYVFNESLNKSAYNHVMYMENNRVYDHKEKEGKTGFTGITHKDRARHTGYKGYAIVRENMTANAQDYKTSINGLLNAIYHRFAFFDFRLDDIGIYAHHGKNLTGYVYNMGNTLLNKGKPNAVVNIMKKQAPIVVFPSDGSTDIDPAFFDEMPMPLPGSKVSGTPVSLQFNGYYFSQAKVSSMVMKDSQGNTIAGKLMDSSNDPNGKFSPLQVTFFPTMRLHYGKAYTVEVEYKATPRSTFKGENKTQMTISFVTDYLKDKKFYDWYKVQDRDIPVLSGERYFVYGHPKDNQDYVFYRNIAYDVGSPNLEKGVYYMHDYNTFDIRLKGKIGESYTIKLKNDKQLKFVISDKDEAIYLKPEKLPKSDSKQKPSGDGQAGDGHEREAAIIYKKGWNALSTPIDKPISQDKKEGNFLMSDLGEEKNIYIMDKGEFKNNPEIISVGQGFMLYAKEDGQSAKIKGKTYPFRQKIQKGWNLFGVSEAVDNPKAYLKLSDKDTLFIYENGKYIKNPTTLKAGQGFFVVRE